MLNLIVINLDSTYELDTSSRFINDQLVKIFNEACPPSYHYRPFLIDLTNTGQ